MKNNLTVWWKEKRWKEHNEIEKKKKKKITKEKNKWIEGKVKTSLYSSSCAALKTRRLNMNHSHFTLDVVVPHRRPGNIYGYVPTFLYMFFKKRDDSHPCHWIRFIISYQRQEFESMVIRDEIFREHILFEWFGEMSMGDLGWQQVTV